MKKQERIISISSSIPISSTFFYSCCLLRQEEGSSFSLLTLPLDFLYLAPLEKGGERGERERFGAEKGDGSCLLVCLNSTHKRLK